jgi:hypothetical protein
MEEDRCERQATVFRAKKKSSQTQDVDKLAIMAAPKGEQ